MRTTTADPYGIESLADKAANFDRAPGLPLMGFVSGTLISLGLWAIISAIVLAVF